MELPRTLKYYAFDGEIKYGFGSVIKSNWLDPYLGIRGGYSFIDDKGFGTGNGLVGFNFWVSENLGLNIQSTYKHSFDKKDGETHFQHTAGDVIKFAIN